MGLDAEVIECLLRNEGVLVLKQISFTVILAAIFWFGMICPAHAQDVPRADPPPAVPSEEEVTDAPEKNKFASKLSPDEPLYFVVGWREYFNAKFQLSFKYAFMNPQGGLSKKAPFFSHVFLGYTQTSLWDIEGDSKPFYDTSYRPSLFYRDDDLYRSESGRYRLWGQIGIEHQSNGQGGDESRSLNTLYVQPVFEYPDVWGGGHLTFKPRLWLYLSKGDENSDIAEYRGYGAVQVAFTGRSEWQLAATLRVGTSGKASVQVDGTWPMDKILSRSFEGYLYAQFFDGWGESLRSYNERLPWQLRLGIAVVR